MHLLIIASMHLQSGIPRLLMQSNLSQSQQPQGNSNILNNNASQVNANSIMIITEDIWKERPLSLWQNDMAKE